MIRLRRKYKYTIGVRIMGIKTWNTKLQGPMQISFTYPPAQDPKVALLLKGGEPNGSTTVVDSSMYNRTMIKYVGNFSYTNAQSKYYSTSILGSQPGILATDIIMPGANKSWTWESWIYFTSSQLTGASSSPAGFLALDANSDTIILASEYAGGVKFGLARPINSSFFSPNTTALQANVWQHLAMTFEYDGVSSGTLRSFYNGVLEGTSSGQAFYLPGFETAPNSGVGTIVIGTNVYTGFSNANYYFSDYQIMQGVAKYTSNFTPPTGPLTGLI